LGGKPEKVGANRCIAMACVAAIQHGRVVNTGVWNPGGRREEIKVDSSFDVMQVGLPEYDPSY